MTKNNFIAVFNKWREEVMPDIQMNWEQAKKINIFCGDFFLADLINDTTKTLYEKLDVVFSDGKYRFQREIDRMLGTEMSKTTQLKTVKNYKAFWNKYERPPKEEHWQWFIERKDLLVPQDVRERKGSFFTPKKWVQLSQKYLADVLGEDWQDDYYIWDCCAGTGNLLKGLSNKRNVFASTLDKGDVGIMKELADQNVLPLFENNIFQFDFLNDDLQSEKVPEGLRKILADENERKKLVIYINPPYAEGDNRNGEGRSGVAISMVHQKYDEFMGYGKREMCIQFLTRIYNEIKGCHLDFFFKLKNIQSSKFVEFQKNFNAKLEKIFIVPGYTFDNVKGQFPIAFQLWNTNEESIFKEIDCDVFDENGIQLNKKKIFSYNNFKVINDWTESFIEDNLLSDENFSLATIIGIANDFQNQKTVRIEFPNKPWNHQYQWQITKNNLIPSVIYLSVRHCIAQAWHNDRDQFLYPNDGWKTDLEFQSDCLAYTLLHGQNRISAAHGTNHWIPFTESEVNAKQAFESTFMTDFMKGRLKAKKSEELGLTNEGTVYDGSQKIVFSEEAKAVLEAGKELYRYYYSKPHVTKEANNASFYDIRAAFQGTGASGKMNASSADGHYNELIADLRAKQKILAKKIEAKVYEYGFLK